MNRLDYIRQPMKEAQTESPLNAAEQDIELLAIFMRHSFDRNIWTYYSQETRQRHYVLFDGHAESILKVAEYLDRNKGDDTQELTPDVCGNCLEFANGRMGHA